MNVPRRWVAHLFLGVVICIQGCGGNRATEEGMKRIQTGMEYKEVVSILGKPCFQSGSDSSPARAWRTADGTRGLYVEFTGSKAVGIADFDTEGFTLRKGGQFSYYTVNDRDYQRRIVGLLKTR